MTANPRHVGPAVPGVWLSRRVRDLLRSIVAVMLCPAMVVSRPVVSLLARHRPRARLRLAAGTHAERAAYDPGAPNPAREPGRRSAGASWQPRATAPTGIGNARVSRAASAEPPFSTVRVGPAFSPRAYAQTFAALQVPPSAKLLDLTAARMLSADLFEQLARAWTAPSDAVPRLGILVSFERWVMLRDTAVAALQPLARRGIKIEIFYAEQAFGVQLPVWFAHGQVVHNVQAAIATLVARWQPATIWPAVIDTLTQLVRAHTGTDERPALLTEVAGLALSCGGADQAATLAR
jgi:hypothetical protein